ncbi:hypothetical protein PENANT_c148G03786 [Penicillium antarcticum]|uniref:Ribonuclease H1 N-terminal domain-containing protein n=1 Tax=Penicillium antarcticum TaxID=416450 RepID=A0A1V6PGE5_9EURO|nr:hypothetical protein PENANT_c148G03786 [Penicillium antarcticum]
MGARNPKEIFKSGAGETTPLGGNGFYAVANGANPGIYPFYHGNNGAKNQVTGEPGSCHKRFRTMAQAKAFIEDWKASYTAIWCELIREALDEGFRPRDIQAFRRHEMSLIVEQFLSRPRKENDTYEVAEQMLSLSLKCCTLE